MNQMDQATMTKLFAVVAIATFVGWKVGGKPYLMGTGAAILVSTMGMLAVTATTHTG